jgi:hypothetical protein
MSSILQEILDNPTQEIVLTGERKREFVRAYLEKNFHTAFFQARALIDCERVTVAPVGAAPGGGVVFSEGAGRKWTFEGKEPRDDPRSRWEESQKSNLDRRRE